MYTFFYYVSKLISYVGINNNRSSNIVVVSLAGFGDLLILIILAKFLAKNNNIHIKILTSINNKYLASLIDPNIDVDIFSRKKLNSLNEYIIYSDRSNISFYSLLGILFNKNLFIPNRIYERITKRKIYKLFNIYNQDFYSNLNFFKYSKIYSFENQHLNLSLYNYQ